MARWRTAAEAYGRKHPTGAAAQAIGTLRIAPFSSRASLLGAFRKIGLAGNSATELPQVEGKLAREPSNCSASLDGGPRIHHQRVEADGRTSGGGGGAGSLKNAQRSSPKAAI